ncbi:MAG: alpha-galactosidase [Myxococcota bacterium]|nr:alpha-galactosidase [Myxococcota bacterium]
MPGPTVVATHPAAGRVEPTRIAVRTGEATAAGRAGGIPGAVTAAPFTSQETRLGAIAMEVAIDPGDTDTTFRIGVRNTRGTPVHLTSAILGFRWHCPGPVALRCFQNGWQSWSETGSRVLDGEGTAPFPSGPWLRGLHHAVGSPPPDRAGWQESHLVSVAGAWPAGAACCAGVLEQGRAFGLVYVRRAAEGAEIEVELWVDALLPPGERLVLEPVRVAVGEDPSRLLEDFAAVHGRSAGARASTSFTSGWCSWYHFFHDVTEADVLRNLEALVAARDEIPVEIVQVDDGWQHAVGDWTQTNDKFPRGLAPLAADIRSAGFVPGLWTAPFCVVRESDLFTAGSDWLLQGDAGPHRALVHPQWSADALVYSLDPTRPEVVSHLEALFRTLVELGFGYLKLDFLYTAAVEARAHDPAVPRAARLRRGLEAIRRGAGEEAILLGCGCPLGPAVGVVDAMRVGPDVAPAWSADAEIPGIEATLPATRSAIRSALTRNWMHRRYWINDPDCLIAREGALGDREAATLAAVIGASGGSCFLSDDLSDLSPPRRALAAATLASARAVDRMGLPGRARTRDLLALPAPTTLVSSDATGETATLVNLDDRALGVDPPASWEGADERLCMNLGPRESAVLRLDREVALAVFCDFDGTFSVQDVGSTLAQRHGGEARARAWARYEGGEITAWEYNMTVLDGLPLPKTEVERFLATIDLDPGAADLVAWCEERGIPFRVVSDGFDANLNRLQELHGVSFEYDANELRYERGRWRLRPGHPDPRCGCGTGVCKRGRIEAFRAQWPGVVAVHVGNGRVSDLCGALAADIAFAKDSLAIELEARRHSFERFETLHDVIARLEQLGGGAGFAEAR